MKKKKKFQPEELDYHIGKCITTALRQGQLRQLEVLKSSQSNGLTV